MATFVTHALVGAALAPLAPAAVPRGRLALVLASLAMLPDLDVIGFALGIPYGAALGHRGLTHSLPFAALCGVVAARLCFRDLPPSSSAAWAVALLAALATASHGFLDAASDGGLGVGFLVPFDAQRWFLPWRGLATSPLSWNALDPRVAARILANEVFYVWLPVAGFLLVVLAARRDYGFRREPEA